MKDFFYKHPAILATVIYVQITTIGIIYAWFYYGYFDINIFDFSEANDFLLAAFKDPIVFIISFIAFMTWFIVISFKVDSAAEWKKLLEEINSAKNLDNLENDDKDYFEKLETRVKKSYKKYNLKYTILIPIFAIYSFGVPAYFGYTNAKDTKKDYDSRVLVEYKFSGANKDSSIKEEELVLLGTSENFTFFYNNKNDISLVIPTSNIFSVQIHQHKDNKGKSIKEKK